MGVLVGSVAAVGAGVPVGAVVADGVAAPVRPGVAVGVVVAVAGRGTGVASVPEQASNNRVPRTSEMEKPKLGRLQFNSTHTLTC